MNKIYERRISDLYIHIVEINKPISNNVISTAIVGSGQSSIAEAAGKQGHNIMFSTNERLKISLGLFYKFLSPHSNTYIWEGNSTYECFDDDGNLFIRLEDVLEEEIERLSLSKELFFGVYQGNYPDKLHVFTYEMSEEKNIGYFGINLQSYKDDVMEAAYKLANYPISSDDIEWLKSFIKKQS